MVLLSNAEVNSPLNPEPDATDHTTTAAETTTETPTTAPPTTEPPTTEHPTTEPPTTEPPTPEPPTPEPPITEPEATPTEQPTSPSPTPAPTSTPKPSQIPQVKSPPKPVFRPTDEKANTPTAPANPSLVLVPLVICGVFLLIWARRRELGSSFASLTGHNDAEALISTSVEASSEKVHSSVQYAPVDNPGDKWEDWEGETDGFSDDDFVNSPPARITSPVGSGPPRVLPGLSTSSPPGSGSGHGGRSVVSPEPIDKTPFVPVSVSAAEPKPEVTNTIVMDDFGATSFSTTPIPPSNSSIRVEAPSSHTSSDSFELLVSGESSSATVEEKSKEEDDLFSQLGMVPTFKKTDPKPPLSFPTSSSFASASSSSSNPFDTLSAAPASNSNSSSSTTGTRNPPPLQSASSLGLDLDDVTADASGWEDDDDWDKGI